MMWTNNFKTAALLLAAAATFLLVWRAGATAAAQNSNQPTAGSQNTGGNQNGAAQPVGSRQAEQQLPMPPGFSHPELFEAIKGRETQPAGQVFKNIRQLKDRPAGQVLRAMNSFSRALGVTCAHCHVEGQWERDDKPTKEIARGMIRMVSAINSEQLKAIPNLRAEATVTCSTCHRGATRPDPRLPGTGGAPPNGQRPAVTPSPLPTATPAPGH